MIRFLTDEHIPAALVVAMRVRGLDVMRVHEAGLASSPDPGILAWAAADDRVLVTFDRQTMPGFLYARVAAGLPTPGVALVDDSLPIGRMADELHVLAACSTSGELRDQVHYVPLT